MYSCGLRVSELTEMKISNIFFDESLIKILGKVIRRDSFLLVVLQKNYYIIILHIIEKT